MYCIKCGAVLDNDAKFCPGCGNEVIKDNDNKHDEVVDSSIVNKEGTDKPKKQKKIILIIFILCIVVIAIIIVLFFTKTRSQSVKPKEVVKEEKDIKEEKIPPSEEYIFPNSDVEYLTDTDIEGLSAEELSLARNEIIARHGRIFTDEKYKSYFESKSWYEGTVEPDKFDANYEDELNDIEKANIELIKKYEISLNDNIKEYYGPILSEYQQAEANNFSGNTSQYPHVNKNLLYYGSDALYYTTIDLCNDGIPELFISHKLSDNSSSYDIVDIYGYANDAAQHLVVGIDMTTMPLDEDGTMGNRTHYTVCDNNMIKKAASSGAGQNSVEFYQLNKNSVTLKQIEGASQDNTSYYRHFSGGLEAEEISLQQYNEITGKYPLKGNIEWHKLSELQISATENSAPIIYKATQNDILGSKYTVIDFDMQATSTLQEKGYDHNVNVLRDGQTSTCWAEGVSGYGIGEKIFFTSSDTKDINALYIKPGFTKSAEDFYNNGCPSKIKIKCGDIEGEADLSDFIYSENSFLIVKLGETFSVNNCSVSIEEAREGKKYEDTCITELYFLNLP